MALTPQDFVSKWKRVTAREKQRYRNTSSGRATYGWPSDLSDEEIPERLLALNLERAKA